MPLQNEKSQSPLCQCWFFLFQDVFKLEIDASSVAISAILSQHGHLLDFFSKQIHALFFRVCSRALCCQRSNQEMTSVLDHHHFHIYTNHKSLNSLLSQTIQTLQLQKWASKLQRYNFEIFYKPGTNNTVADALSREFLGRGFLDGGQLPSSSSPTPIAPVVFFHKGGEGITSQSRNKSK